MTSVHIELLPLVFGETQTPRDEYLSQKTENICITVNTKTCFFGILDEAIPNRGLKRALHPWRIQTHLTQCSVICKGRTEVHQLQISTAVWHFNFIQKKCCKVYPDTFLWRMKTGGKRSSVEAKHWFRLCQRTHTALTLSSLRITFPNLKQLFTHMLLTTKNTPTLSHDL